MHGSAVYVVSKLSMGHDEYTDVAHRTQIHKLTHLVFKETLIDECEKYPLDNTWKEETIACFTICSIICKWMQGKI